jgi:murein DD-endopeptidase MepM/ murein hydrolase activator NlpD
MHWFRYLLLIVLLMSCTAHSEEVYRWKDKQGRTQYADQASAAPNAAQEHYAPDDSGQAFVELESINHSDGWNIYVSNRLSGPVEVQLNLLSARDISTQPQLPTTRVLNAKERVLITQVFRNGNSADFNINMYAVRGDPMATTKDRAYRLPFDETANYSLSQAFHGGFTHSDEQNRFAVDFSMPVGTPILAARGGVVMETSSDFDRAGTSKKYASRANFIRILHDDGSMAVYAHLKQNGVMVREGQEVTIGQLIGYSGNTGYSSGPHLHFVVQMNHGMRLVSIPFRMVGPDGFVEF